MFSRKSLVLVVLVSLLVGVVVGRWYGRGSLRLEPTVEVKGSPAPETHSARPLSTTVKTSLPSRLLPRSAAAAIRFTADMIPTDDGYKSMNGCLRSVSEPPLALVDSISC